jgi:hypothetical protein
MLRLRYLEPAGRRFCNACGDELSEKIRADRVALDRDRPRRAPGGQAGDAGGLGNATLQEQDSSPPSP